MPAVSLPAARITLRSAEAISAVNPFIFGQQIEFMGPCIDGGIWAELLRNRRFGIPDENGDGVSEEWIPVRGAGNADYSLDSSNPYCGEFSQRVTVRDLNPKRPPGVWQDHVPAVFHQEYLGTIWLRAENFDGKVIVGLARMREPLYVSATLGPVTSEWTRFEFRLTSPIEDPHSGFHIQFSGKGNVWLGPVSLMCAGHEDGLNHNVMDYLRRSRPPHMRWPGGCYADYYHFEQAIGPRDRRSMVWDPQWYAWCPNDFGTDEFIAFCRKLGAEPSITLNIKTGTAEEAANWVEYCNGDSSTRYGKKRAENGHPEPFNVKYWSLGNESYSYFTAEQYADKAKELADAIKAVDPSLILCAVGRGLEWDTTVAERADSHFDWIAEHYYFPSPWVKEFTPQDEIDVTRQTLARPVLFEAQLRAIRAMLDDTGEKHGKRIEIVLDEWNAWPTNGLIPSVWGEEIKEDPESVVVPVVNILQNDFTIREGLHAAVMLHMLHRLGPEVAGANIWSSCNESGIIRTDGQRSFATPTHHVFDLYRNLNADRVLATEVDCATMRVKGGEEESEEKDVPVLDVLATANSEKLFLHILNRSLDTPCRTQLALDGIASPQRATRHVLTADRLRAKNSFSHPDYVQPIVDEFEIPGSEIEYTFPPYSLTVFELRREE